MPRSMRRRVSSAVGLFMVRDKRWIETALTWSPTWAVIVHHPPRVRLQEEVSFLMATNLDPIHIWQAQIKNHYCGRILGSQIKPFLATRGNTHPIAALR